MNLAFIPQKQKNDDKDFLSSNEDLNPVIKLKIKRIKNDSAISKRLSFGKQKNEKSKLMNTSLAKFKV